MNKKFATLLTALALGATTMVAHAGDDLMSPAFDACLDKANSTVDMLDCIDAETQRQDQRLNEVYTALRADVQEGRKNQLRDAQRAWINFRNANCAFHLDPDAGSLARISAADCVLRLTATRAEELAQFLPEDERFPVAKQASAPAPAAAPPAAAPPSASAPARGGNMAEQLAADMGAERTMSCMFISARMVGALSGARPGSDEAAMRDGFMAMSKVYGGLMGMFPSQQTNPIQSRVQNWVKNSGFEVLSPYFDRNCADPRVFELGQAGFNQ